MRAAAVAPGRGALSPGHTSGGPPNPRSARAALRAVARAVAAAPGRGAPGGRARPAARRREAAAAALGGAAPCGRAGAPPGGLAPGAYASCG